MNQIFVPEQINVRNRLLREIPITEYARLKPHLQYIKLELGDVLCEAGQPLQWAWFMTEGIASLVSVTLNGNAIEVGMVGNEGVVGMPILLKEGSLPYRVNIQLSGSALRLPMSILHSEFGCTTPLYKLFTRYTFAVMVQFVQSGVCNHFHSIKNRLCRWLLILHDHALQNTFYITQELLSEMLGVRRAGVTVAAGALQSAGLIKYSRGKITILNREGIESLACECYEAVKTEFNQIFKVPQSP